MSRQTAMKFIQEVNIGRRTHSSTSSTKEISVLLSLLFAIISFLSNLKVHLKKKKGVIGKQQSFHERVHIEIRCTFQTD